MRKLISACFLLGALLAVPASQAQYKADHIPGFVGLEDGTQPPPGIYAQNLVWVYPTSTVKGNNGNNIAGGLSLTSSLEVIGLSVVTNAKVLGGNYSATVAIPFIKNRIQLDSLDVNTGFAFTDMILSPVSLGWHLKRADVTAAYNLYLPTGTYSPNGKDNTGLGMYGNELSAGSTVHLDQKRQWSVAATFSTEFNSDKSGTNIHVGTTGTVEGGFGRTFYKKVSGPIPMITNVGVAGYSQFKMTGDSGSDIPLLLRGYKDHVFALGPEVNTFIPKVGMTLLCRYEPEFAARNRTQGQTIVISVAFVLKPLTKHPAP